MVLLLIAAAAVSLVLGDRIEAAAIGVVILLNAALGFVIELRARRAMESLLQLQAARASTLRDGHIVVVPAETLVPGDVTELTAGQTVPADGRVIVSHNLRTNEAALTGESLPVGKVATAGLPKDTLLADRITMVYKGTTVVSGRGHMVITATGSSTEVERSACSQPRSATSEHRWKSGLTLWAGASSGSRSVWQRLLPTRDHPGGTRRVDARDRGGPRGRRRAGGAPRRGDHRPRRWPPTHGAPARARQKAARC